MRGAWVALVVGVVLMGCQPDELHVGMVPALQVATPDNVPGSPDYVGVTFGTHWELGGIEVTTGSAHMDAGETWTTMDATTNMTTVAGTLWLGWHLTYAQHETAKAWLVLRPSVGMYYWSEADNEFGVMTGIRTGVGVYLNEFNTIGLEYGYNSLQGTHDDGATQTQGLYFTYSIVF